MKVWNTCFEFWTIGGTLEHSQITNWWILAITGRRGGEKARSTMVQGKFIFPWKFLNIKTIHAKNIGREIQNIGFPGKINEIAKQILRYIEHRLIYVCVYTCIRMYTYIRIYTYVWNIPLLGLGRAPPRGVPRPQQTWFEQEDPPQKLPPRTKELQNTKTQIRVVTQDYRQHPYPILIFLISSTWQIIF